MYHIIVCGATRPDSYADGAMFSDFMGIAMTLRHLNPEVNGTFLSCFPLDKHFDWLAKSKPPITDIKWGSFGPQKAPLFTYSKTKWSTRQEKWFEEVDPNDLIARVVSWIHEKGSTVTSGDCVNIFFQCHGLRKGGIALGKKVLESAELAQLFKLFPAGVQVNAIGSHCYSGKLVDAIRAVNLLDRYAVAACGPNQLSWTARRSVSNRCRNFRFSQPFIQSLSRMRLPGIKQENTPPITLENHENFMRDALRRVTPGAPDTTYYSHLRLSPEKEAALILLEELILYDKADVLYSREATHRRRRVEYPILGLALLNRMRQGDSRSAPPHIRKQVTATVQEFSAECDFDNTYFGDGSILGQLEIGDPDYSTILKLLYWRSRQQSTVWDLFQILCERRFLDMKVSLADPVDFRGQTADVGAIFSLLTCFELPHKDEHLAESPPFEGWDYSDGSIIWLAVMIGRGCGNPNLMFELIDFTNMLGPLKEDLVLKHRNSPIQPKVWSCDPHAMAGKGPNYFGLWLPHGLGTDYDTYSHQIHKRIKRFNHIEALYKAYLNLTDEELLLEHQQDTYFRRHPEREPGLKHSGH